MTLKKEKKKNGRTNILYTIVCALLICVVFLSTASYLFKNAEDEAYEMLHIQTKQIKDNLVLQLKSDRENLVTMANFASKLYADGEGYDRMFASFKPIGLFSNIGILNPDNTFVTKKGKIDLSGKISFVDEVMRGEYVSSRLPDLTGGLDEIVRSAVPIKVGDNTVGILYGVIKLDTINQKYGQMAQDIEAQLFVYDKEEYRFIIDTINKTPGELSSLEERKYNDGYSYNDFYLKENGYSSFGSIQKDENLYLHYSTIEDFNWGIMLARYEAQVFANVRDLSNVIVIAFIIMVFMITIYLGIILKNEKQNRNIIHQASDIRRLLLNVNDKNENVYDALKNIVNVSTSKSAFFIDANGKDYYHITDEFKDNALNEEERKYFAQELFRIVMSYRNTGKSTVEIVSIVPSEHLQKRNEKLHDFLTSHKVEKLMVSLITDKNNYISILGVVNPKNENISKEILDEVSICFSIAIYNKNYLAKTETIATTDSLTGALNRVSYNKDILRFDQEKNEDFYCIYIDANELHLINNKYGHAAGDQMLIFIANTLKKLFFGHHVYRMGGDEFLVFAKGISNDKLKENIDVFTKELAQKNYNVSCGVSYRKQNSNCEEMVREAEVRMYEAKASYYQNKENSVTTIKDDDNYAQAKTGILEIDTMLSVLKEHYNGIYKVSLKTDEARRILMPSYLGYNEYEERFSHLLKKYIDELVHPDFHRSVINFLNYDVIKRHLAEGRVPRITYKKVNGESVILSVYKLDGAQKEPIDTLWVFSKD